MKTINIFQVFADSEQVHQLPEKILLHKTDFFFREITIVIKGMRAGVEKGIIEKLKESPNKIRAAA